MMQVLLDTCILVDALQEREPFAESAKEIFREAAMLSFYGCITAKSLADVYYILRKHTHSEKETRDAIGRLCALFEPLDTCANDCICALSSPITDWEDAIMAETAARAGVSAIVTRNKKDFAASRVSPLLPEEFLALLKADSRS